MHSTRSADRGRVNTYAYNFFVCGPNFTKIFLFNVGGIVVDQVCFRFWYLDPRWRYSRSKSKVVRNRAEFSMF